MTRLILISVLFVFLFVPVESQTEDDTCPPTVMQAIQLSSDECMDIDRNSACYGHESVIVQPHDDIETEIFAAVGDIEPIANIHMLETAALNEDDWGIAILSLQANLPDTVAGQVVTIVLFGDVTLEAESDVEGYSAPFQAFHFSAGVGSSSCAGIPEGGLLIQAPQDTTVNFVANGVEITIGSTGLIDFTEDELIRVSTFDGQIEVTSVNESQIIEPGNETLVDAQTPPTEPVVYEYDRLKDIPTELLPEPIGIPIVIPPSVLWIATGIELEAGQTFTITATGGWDQTVACESWKEEGIHGSYEDCLSTAPVSPAGNPDGLTGNILGHPPIWPMMDVPMGALIGQIGEGELFDVMEGGTFTATTSGQLMLGNNLPGPALANQGGYIAIVEVD